ncbi:MAG: rRNA adenine dimethyltransferase family protein [Leptospiraceae bacterium]
MQSYPFFSPSRIQQALSARGGAILKSKGQNFLTDPNAVRVIAESVLALLPFRIVNAGDTDPPEDLEILEIGPGTGALSFALWDSIYELALRFPETRFKYRALELDPLLCSILSEETLKHWMDKLGIHPSDTLGQDWQSAQNATWTISNNLSFHLHNCDARVWLERSFASGQPSNSEMRIICGNLPYYISTELLLKSVALRPRACAFLVQKEYAQRILDTRKSSSISVFVRNSMDPFKGPSISRGCFLPPPSVESSVLILKSVKPKCESQVLEPLLRKSFQGKRKTLRNSWRNNVANEEELNELEAAANQSGIDWANRAEDLKPEDFYSMARFITESGNSG